MVMIKKKRLGIIHDQKEKAGNHSLRSFNPIVCNWIQFGDCQVWQVLIFGGGGGFGADKV